MRRIKETNQSSELHKKLSKRSDHLPMDRVRRETTSDHLTTPASRSATPLDLPLPASSTSTSEDIVITRRLALLSSSSDDNDSEEDALLTDDEKAFKIDRILDHRVVADLSDSSTFDAYDPGLEYEYYIKWEGRSYLHLEWVCQDRIIKECYNGGSRIIKYWQKFPMLKQKRQAWLGDCIVLFDPRFVQIDRILAWKRLTPDMETSTTEI